jgi:hypothetical protein
MMVPSRKTRTPAYSASERQAGSIDCLEALIAAAPAWGLQTHS